MLMGPNEESAQWLAQAVSRHGFHHAVCCKIRHGDRAVEVALPDVAVAGRLVVLHDDVDVVSTDCIAHSSNKVSMATVIAAASAQLRQAV